MFGFCANGTICTTMSPMITLHVKVSVDTSIRRWKIPIQFSDWLVFVHDKLTWKEACNFNFGNQGHTKCGRTHAVSWLVVTLEILGLGQHETRGCFFYWAQNNECVLIGNLGNELVRTVPPHSFPFSSSVGGWRWWARNVLLLELKKGNESVLV